MFPEIVFRPRNKDIFVLKKTLYKMRYLTNKLRLKVGKRPPDLYARVRSSNPLTNGTAGDERDPEAGPQKSRAEVC